MGYSHQLRRSLRPRNASTAGGTASGKGYTATTTGADYWVATYCGNTNNNSVTSSGEPVAITYGLSGFLAAIVGSQVKWRRRVSRSRWCSALGATRDCRSSPRTIP